MAHSDVRIAIADDEPHVMELMRMAHMEGGQHVINEQKVMDMLRTCFNRQGGLIGVIGTPGDPLRGALVMTMAPVWYSDEWQLMELVNFVHPDHRRSNYAKQLIGFGKWCADQMNIDLMIGVLTNVRTEAKVHLYERQLSKAAGAFFVYHPTTRLQ